MSSLIIYCLNYILRLKRAFYTQQRENIILVCNIHLYSEKPRVYISITFRRISTKSRHTTYHAWRNPQIQKQTITIAPTTKWRWQLWLCKIAWNLPLFSASPDSILKRKKTTKKLEFKTSSWCCTTWYADYGICFAKYSFPIEIPLARLACSCNLKCKKVMLIRIQRWNGDHEWWSMVIKCFAW